MSLMMKKDVEPGGIGRIFESGISGTIGLMRPSYVSSSRPTVKWKNISKGEQKLWVFLALMLLQAFGYYLEFCELFEGGSSGCDGGGFYKLRFG